MEYKPYYDNIPNYIDKVISISCIWQLQFILYVYVAMKKKVLETSVLGLGISPATVIQWDEVILSLTWVYDN